MSKKIATKQQLPKRRFPEFVKSSVWINEPLKNLYYFLVTNSFSREKLSYKKGSVKNIHYGDIHTKFSKLFDIRNEIVPFIIPSESLMKIKPECYCVEGDIIFADASEDMDDIGKSIEIIQLNDEKLLSGLHTLLARQKDEKIIVGFGGYLFKSSEIRKQIKKESQGTKVLGISAKRLLNIDIVYPSNKDEQQKIAGCLFSLDELIIAQTQKIDGLKEYKKGLVQQLFPKEGEVVPELRFPEFRKLGKWKKKQMEKIAFFLKGKGVSKSDISKNATQPCIRYGELYTHYNEIIDSVKSYTNVPLDDLILSQANDVIIPASGETREDIATASCVLNSDIALGGDLNIIRSKLNGVFLSYYLNNAKKKSISQLAQGVSVMHIYSSQLKKLYIQIPDLPEQKKIANSLSSLDALITEEVEKLDVFKEHEKGLMQQLFPSSNEDEG